ncbi:signal peptidase I [Patulibacter sp. S7RM1-6]
MAVAPATVLSPEVAPAAAGPGATLPRVARWAAVAGLVTLAAVLLGLKLSGWQPLTVMTGSMRPTIAPGQVVVVTPMPATDLRPGQIVTFNAPNGDGTFTHRVVRSVSGAGGELVVTTKGDANPAGERWRIAPTGTVGHVRAILPRAGGAIAALVAGPGRPRFVLGTTVVAALLVLWWIWGPDATERRKARGRGA